METPILIFESAEMKGKIAEVTRKGFTYEYVNGQRFLPLVGVFEKGRFECVSIDFSKVPISPDFLTAAEIADVEASWREIEEGRAKKFRTVDEFLAELRTT